MRRAVTALAVLFIGPATVPAQDAPTEAVVTAVKRATVFVQVQGTDWKGTGSGLVVRADKDAVLVATNYHVLVGPAAERRTRPAEAGRLARASTVKLVFDSGTKTERTARADVVAVDPEADLAVLRVTGLADPPVPINAAPPKVFETMAVYSFGFPFGAALGVGQASPAVTVGKASVSSLRNGDDGELSVIQIDGNLNPGNSGGPVVDVKGQLVGVAVAKVRDGQGIGFAVPAGELNRVMAGGLGRPHLSIAPGEGGKVTVKVEVGVIDPDAAIKGVTLQYVLVEPKGKKPGRADEIEKIVGVKRLALKVEGGVATGDLVLDAPAGELFVKALPDGPAGKRASAIRSLDLAGTAALAGGKPPAGWKEFVAKDNGFSVWVPDGAKNHSERERQVTVRGLNLRTHSVTVEMANGLIYTADQLTLPPGPAVRLKRGELEDGFRDWVATELNGKVVEESEVQIGAVTGREYRVVAGGRAARVRLFVAAANRVILLQVTGTNELLEADGPGMFLNSCRLSPAVVPKDVPVGPGPRVRPGPGPGAEVVKPGPAPTMLGFRIGPEFKELPPEGGMLIGLELGLLDNHGNTLVRAVRPIYRVGNTEVFGLKRGTAPGPVVTLKAKPGYVVGALTAKTALAINGLSLTFVRAKDGKLDPADAHESDWVGSDPPNLKAVKVDGGGEPAVGLVGRADERNLIAIGLVFRGQEKGLGPVLPFGIQRTLIHGGGFDPEFTDMGPAGSLLAGLEVGLTKVEDRDVIRAVRPIFRKGDKDEFGPQHGTDLARVIKLVARPGFAVGAVTLKLTGAVEGLSVTFMRVRHGTLDPADSYESEWAGANGGQVPLKLGGTGAPVVGIVGKANVKDVTGLGLALNSGVTTPPPGPALTPLPPVKVEAPRLVGFMVGPEFRESALAGGILVGLEVGLSEGGKPQVRAVRAIYRVGDKEVPGEQHGKATGPTMTLKARDGYAIGALTARSTLAIDGLSVTFMRTAGSQLVPADAYESDWVGAKPAARPEVKLDGGGSSAVGLTGRMDGTGLIALGLAFRGQGPDAVAPPGSRTTRILGGASDREFVAVGAEGSLLVGLEIGLGKYFDEDVVRAVRAVHRKETADQVGTWHGTDTTRVIKVVAKPGYAVGAITLRAGLTMDGLSVTFMKVVDGKLDPADAYESEWVGRKVGAEPVKVGGDGASVIGLAGKANGRDATGLGLLQRK